ncbi:dihydropteroate synthase, partial [Micromonospora sp. NPDC048868]|uniref:dihydropteroate synthase n=1 Tax=Micromonospora sp. NPDC048868 TaxID=3364258 RepID=UPI00371E9347
MAGALRLGGRTFGPDELVVMAIVNRTPDSFFDQGATFAQDSALRAVERAVEEGAEIIDIGGVKAGPGAEVDVAEEIRRTVATIAAVRAAFPDVVISIDTWRAEVAVEAVAAGADLLNDTWSGAGPALAQVAAQTGAGLVCSHAGGLAPRTRPHRA